MEDSCQVGHSAVADAKSSSVKRSLPTGSTSFPTVLQSYCWWDYNGRAIHFHIVPTYCTDSSVNQGRNLSACPLIAPDPHHNIRQHRYGLKEGHWYGRIRWHLFGSSDLHCSCWLDLLEPNPKYTASITQYIIDVHAHPYNLVCLL